MSFRARFDPADRAVVSSIDHVERTALRVPEHQRIGVPEVEHHHRVGNAGLGNIDLGFGNDRRVVGNLLGGQLADRFGATRVAVAGFGTLLPLAPVLVVVTNVPAALVVLVAQGDRWRLAAS